MSLRSNVNYPSQINKLQKTRSRSVCSRKTHVSLVIYGFVNIKTKREQQDCNLNYINNMQLL